MTSEEILTFRGVSKHYKVGESDVKALTQASFNVNRGQTIAIVGPSGSGKSTLLALAAGLEQPTAGKVTLAGSELGSLSEEKLALLRRENVGFVFQSFQLLSSLTALENVMVPLELARKSEPKRKASELLSRVGLAERMQHYPRQLSGGEQQRVALARAYANSPVILFADEPTGNLDERNADVVAEMLFALNAEHGTTLIIATHNDALSSMTQRRLQLLHGAVSDV